MTPQQLLLTLIAAPGAAVLLLGTIWLFGGHLPERITARITKTLYAALTVMVCWLGWRLYSAGTPSLHVKLGNWFSAGHYSFPLSFVVDRLSWPMVAMTILLAGIVGSFSVRYMHRDPGFQRFFILLHLFVFGAMLVFTADCLDVLIAGWELVGITSVLLIGFFQYRPDPVRNALRVFGTYRIADLCILTAVFLCHHWFGAATFSRLFTGEWPSHVQNVAGSQATIIAVLLVFAASGKASQGPFCGWLPRAMEGPTPSSAVFYGAISVHAGAYLLLRVEPLIHASAIATGLVIFIGATTAFLGTLIHRTCADAKTGLAYASQTQLGLIFVEIGLGWTTFATAHIIGHAMLRTMQFLRAPSMLHDHHRVHAAAGGHLTPTGSHWEAFLPDKIQTVLYRIAIGRGFYDAIVDRFIIHPTKMLAKALGWLEPSWGTKTAPSPEPPLAHRQALGEES